MTGMQAINCKDWQLRRLTNKIDMMDEVMRADRSPGQGVSFLRLGSFKYYWCMMMKRMMIINLHHKLHMEYHFNQTCVLKFAKV